MMSWFRVWEDERDEGCKRLWFGEVPMRCRTPVVNPVEVCHVHGTTYHIRDQNLAASQAAKER